MAIQPQVFTVPTMVTGTSITPAITMAGIYLDMYLAVPTMSAGFSASTPIYLQGSADGITFYRYSNPENNTSTVGANDFSIVSSVSQRMIYIPSFSFQYVKVEISGTATNAIASTPQFKFVCVSNQ